MKGQMSGQSTYGQKGRTANTGLAKVAVQCSTDTFVVNQSLVIRTNISVENRHLRQARKRSSMIHPNIEKSRLVIANSTGFVCIKNDRIY